VDVTCSPTVSHIRSHRPTSFDDSRARRSSVPNCEAGAKLTETLQQAEAHACSPIVVQSIEQPLRYAAAPARSASARRNSPSFGGLLSTRSTCIGSSFSVFMR